jgi:hypothetical protein
MEVPAVPFPMHSYPAALLNYDLATDGETLFLGRATDGSAGTQTGIVFVRELGDERKGDVNLDGAVAEIDAAFLAYCLAGPDASHALGRICSRLDMDSGDTVDLLDVAAFQREFGCKENVVPIMP